MGSAVASETKELVTTNVYKCKAFGMNYSFVLYLSVPVTTFE